MATSDCAKRKTAGYVLLWFGFSPTLSLPAALLINPMRAPTMKIKLMAVVIASLIAAPVLAEKSDWAGDDKAATQLQLAHQTAMQAKDDTQSEYGDAMEDMKKEKKDKSEKMKKEKKDKKDKLEKTKDKKSKDMKDGMDDHEEDMKDHKKKMKKSKEKHADDMDGEHEDMQESKHDKAKGLEKQREKKHDQVQNELDKGSEKGKAKREENSKKWWKIWGDDES